MKIAWFTPFSKKSAIGQYSSIIIEHLSKSTDITVYVSDASDNQETWIPNTKQYFLKSSPQQRTIESLAAFDIVIYNLGDNYLLHGDIFEVARQHSGIVILHDLVMHHFFSGYYFLQLHNQRGYVNELTFSHGEAGRELGQKIVNGKMGNIWETETMLAFHMAKSALHGCLGAITHSSFAEKQIEVFATYPVMRVDFPTPRLDPPTIRRFDNNGKVRLLSFGMLNRNKMIYEVIDLIGNSPSLRDQIVYDVIGTGNNDYIVELHKCIEHHKLQDIVSLHGYQPDKVLHTYIRDADVIVNLRNPHFGESSWVLLEAAFSAKPVLVWKHGYYDEYPDDAVNKVTGETLATSLERLATDQLLRQQLSTEIYSYAQRTFKTELYCQQLLKFIDEVRRKKPLLLLIDEMSRYVEEINALDQDLIKLVTEEISTLLLP